MRGILVTFEGNDAAGKSTLMERVYRQLKQAGLLVLTVPEFSSRLVGRFLQETLVENKFLRLNDLKGPSSLTESLYIISDLYSQDELDIKPALQKGMIVLKERHRDSIVACQIPKIMNDYPNANQIFWWIQQVCSQLTEPDLTIFLRVSSDKEVKRRIKAREGVGPTAADFAVFRERQVIYDRLAAENQHRWFEVINNDESPEDSVEIISEEIMRRWVVH